MGRVLQAAGDPVDIVIVGKVVQRQVAVDPARPDTGG